MILRGWRDVGWVSEALPITAARQMMGNDSLNYPTRNLHNWGIAPAICQGNQVKEESSSFLKKRTKKLLIIGRAPAARARK
jgi:hypothetical protein